eukprot:1343988-Prymnesium_polylepis.1
MNVAKRRLWGPAHPARRYGVASLSRNRVARATPTIGPISTDPSQPCGQTDCLYHRHAPTHIYGHCEVNKARIVLRAQPKMRLRLERQSITITRSSRSLHPEPTRTVPHDIPTAHVASACTQ